MRTVILIDARNFCHRHGYTHRGLSANGHPTGMLYGCISGMMRLSRLHPNAAIVFVWDGDNAKESWRHKISKIYKDNRTPKEAKSKLKPEVKAMWAQIPVFEAFLKNLGFRQLKVKSLEADDLIGILAFHVRTMVDKVVVYSSDRDFYQFISTEIDICRDIDKTRNCKPHTARMLRKEFGVGPRDWLKYRALVGDKGDRILGIPGIGPKRAIELLSVGVDASKAKCKIKDTKHKKIGYVKKNWPHVRLNYKLSRILRSSGAKILSLATAKECNVLLRQIKAFDDLFRHSDGKTKKVYRWMIQWFAEREMNDLMERRLELWKLL